MHTVKDFYEMKQQQVKITMMTAYDYPSAKQVESAGIDMILVGDSLGMTVLGYDGTMQVTLSDMIHHAKAARRGAPDTFIVADMPMGSYGISSEFDLLSAVELYQATSCNAIKLEGNHPELIKRCTAIGIPVIAHLGLTPQSAGITGYTVQGKTKASAEQLIETAHSLADAGAIMLVLEAVPSDLAASVANSIHIPVIGIGAGIETDGQVLVYHDVLNYATERQPKFVKQYGDYSVGVAALKEYHREVKDCQFPNELYTYKVKVMKEVNQDADD